MALSSGSKLGPYEIVGPIGAGGMGEVYRARDTRLGRDVAIKVLPGHLAESPEAKQRFEREARAVSSLSHANICALFDVGSQNGVEYLVMEFLEGETLTARLVRGPLKLEDVQRIGIELADALEKAHRQGLVHRDLKPGNVMLTKSGAKLMDFGLAKPSMAMTPANDLLTPSGPTMSVAALTAASSPLTQKGMIVGTFQYIAPEILQGKEADARSDIFSLGCVLFEMATGKRAFEGKSQLSVFTAILESEPAAVSSLQPLAPKGLDDLVKNCLAKDPEERISSAHDVKLQLRALDLRSVATPSGVMPVPSSLDTSAKFKNALLGLLAFLLVCAIAGLLALWNPKSRATAAPLTFTSILLPEGVYPVSISNFAGPATISPDGTQIVFSARENQNAQMLWLRRLSEPTAKPLAGTEGAFRPFWSPDSRNIGFFSDSKLKRVSADGGPVLTLADVGDGRGGAWNRDGVIIFSAGSYGPLYRVSASGGEVSQLTTLDSTSGEMTHRFPQFLPDGKHFLYMRRISSAGAGIGAAILVSELGKPGAKRVLESGSNAVYANGYLLFVRERALMAVKFDPDKLATEGEPVPIVEDVRMDLRFTQGVFSASDNGTLVFQTGEGRYDQILQIFARDGSLRSTVGEPAEFFLGGDPQISPDGTKAVVAVLDPQTGNADIMLCDLKTGVRRRLTTGPGDKFTVVISPDGTRIAYPVRPTNGRELWRLQVQPIAGNAAPQTLISAPFASILYIEGWTPDGKNVLFSARDVSDRYRKINVVSLDGGQPSFAVNVNGDLSSAQVSPTGRFVAYVSNESGRNEVYVASFPSGPGRWQVSQSGGIEPRWRGDGKELFFFAPDNHLMAAQTLPVGTDFQVGEIKPLFQLLRRGYLGWRYDVSRDGQWILAATDVPDKRVPQITVVTNWQKLLNKQIVP